MKRLAYDDIVVDQSYQTKHPDLIIQTLNEALDKLAEYEGLGDDEFMLDVTITVKHRYDPARATPAGER